MLRRVNALPVDPVGDDGRTQIVRVPGHLSHIAAAELDRTVKRIIALHNVSRIILDLTLVEVVTSIGVTSLLESRQTSQDHATELILAGLPEQHRSFFTLLRVDQLFDFENSVDEAVNRPFV